ncbi:MAG: hypothetical protein ACYDEX_19950, partial [Mobilitalea sp.]
MIGLLYLFLCFTIGWVICSFAFPGLDQVTWTDYDKRKIAFSPYLLLLPAWYVTGTLAITWTTYLIAFVFGKTEEPLFYANLIVIPVALLVSIFVYYKKYYKNK